MCQETLANLLHLEVGMTCQLIPWWVTPWLNFWKHWENFVSPVGWSEFHMSFICSLQKFPQKQFNKTRNAGPEWASSVEECMNECNEWEKWKHTSLKFIHSFIHFLSLSISLTNTYRLSQLVFLLYSQLILGKRILHVPGSNKPEYLFYQKKMIMCHQLFAVVCFTH